MSNPYYKKEDFTLPKQNIEIRNVVRESGLRLWQIADAMGMSDTYFSKKLRHELTATEKERIYQTIKTLQEEGANIT